MKITYCIIAHNEPEFFGRLINSLQHPSSNIFAHIDASKDQSKFENAIGNNSVYFANPRIKCYHGGFSLVKACLETLKQATARTDGDYFVMLSGQCYPVKPMDHVYSHFNALNGMDLMSFYPLVKGANCYEHVGRYHFPETKNELKLFKLFISIAERLLPRPSRKFSVPIYRGSHWSAFSRQTAELLSNSLETELGKKISAQLKYSFGSDEIYNQTYLLNSDRKFNCVGWKEYSEDGRLIRGDKSHMHYIDWSKSRERPAILDYRDLEYIKKTSDLFARKFRIDKSKDLLDSIDAERLNFSKVYTNLH